ncbi:MAG: aromatic amino acid lyase, partial [Myxococcota bacterium]
MIAIDGQTLTPMAVAEVAEGRSDVELEAKARTRLEATAQDFAERGQVDVLRSKWKWLVGGEVPTTPDLAVRAFVESHCAGVGEPLSALEVWAMLVTRANALACGVSGVRAQVVERLLDVVSRRWVPHVPSQGAVGAAGSIALAHAARVVLGLGGTLAHGPDAPFAPLPDDWPVLEATEKEALSLINGSSLTTGLAALAVVDADRVLAAAEAACALSMEAVRADRNLVDAAAAARRGHDGIAQVTERL